MSNDDKIAMPDPNKGGLYDIIKGVRKFANYHKANDTPFEERFSYFEEFHKKPYRDKISNEVKNMFHIGDDSIYKSLASYIDKNVSEKVTNENQALEIYEKYLDELITKEMKRLKGDEKAKEKLEEFKKIYSDTKERMEQKARFVAARYGLSDDDLGILVNGYKSLVNKGKEEIKGQFYRIIESHADKYSNKLFGSISHEFFTEDDHLDLVDKVGEDHLKEKFGIKPSQHLGGLRQSEIVNLYSGLLHGSHQSEQFRNKYGLIPEDQKTIAENYKEAKEYDEKNYRHAA